MKCEPTIISVVWIGIPNNKHVKNKQTPTRIGSIYISQYFSWTI